MRKFLANRVRNQNSDEYLAELAEYLLCLSFRPISHIPTNFLHEPEYSDEYSSA